MSEGLTVVDANGNLIAWNRRFEQMFAAPTQLNGADREQEQGFVRTTVDENWRLFAADAERLVQTSCRMPGEALNHLASDGRTIEIKSSLMPHGGAVTIYTDVTERKRVDREMRAAREAAETADRAKSEFVAMISHELRTPMNGVLGLTSLLLDTKLDSTQMRYARAIDESGNRLLGLINEILDLFRLEAGRAELECAPFDLPALIKSVTDTTRVLVGDKPISVTARIENGVPRMLLGAGDRIYQILQNLLGNAAKFTERGTIELRVSCRASAEPLKLIRIEISDTGPASRTRCNPGCSTRSSRAGQRSRAGSAVQVWVWSFASGWST
jgi:signal transduction histidine kinase